MTLLLPEGWPRPSGYAHGVAAQGRLLFVGGQVGWNAAQIFETDDCAEQIGQALRNVAAVLRAGAARPEHVVSMTWFLTDRHAYLNDRKRVAGLYRAVMGGWFPAMAVVEVAALMEPRAKVEIQAIAVIPE